MPQPLESIDTSIDTQSDLRHDHSHMHGEPHRHDHQHQPNFSGAHTHPHAHVHRHETPPHGGTIISLRLTGHASQDDIASAPAAPLSPHLEMVAELPERLWIYFLEEASDGQWKPWDFAPQQPKLELWVDHNSVQQNLIWNAQRKGYQLELPKNIQSVFETKNREIRFRGWLIQAGNLIFDAPTDLVYQDGGLDVAID